MADYDVNSMEERFPEEWVAAMRAPVVKDRVSVILSRGGEKTDEDISEHSLYINRKVMGSKFDVGTCCISEMGVSFTDDNAIDTNYGGALATVVYSLCVDEEADDWYSATAGPFIVNGQKTRRVGNVVTIKAYDVLSNFDIDLPKNNIPEFANLYAAVDWLCDVVPRVNGIRFGAMPEEEFNTLPNADIVPDLSSDQIVSCRDALMWIAQVTGTCVFYGRQGITFKQYRYTGNLTHDRKITVDERESIEFTDTRTYCTYLSAESADKPKIYSNVVEWDETWDPKYIKTGGLNLPKNPIISALTEQQQDEINKNILKNMSCPTRYIKMIGDVDFLIEPLDCVGFTGGVIDIRNMIIAPATEINWKYRMIGKIVCTNVEEYTETLSDEIIPVALFAGGVSTQAETSPTVYSPVYSQETKARQGKDSATKLVGNFGGQYVLKWDSPMGLKAYDDKGNEVMELRIHPDSNQFILESGTSKVEFVGDNLKIKHNKMGIEFVNGQQFYIYDKNGTPIFWLNPDFGAMRFSNASKPSGFEVNIYNGEIKMNGQTVFKTS